MERLLKKHCQSLNDAVLKTLMAEVELIINPRPITVDTLKTNVIMPPPGVFTKPDLYSRRKWRRVQHFPDEFWHRLRKEFLQSFQRTPKWNNERRNFEVGDIAILKEQDCQRNQWPLARIIGVDTDRNGDVGNVTLRVADSNNDNQTLRKPIT